MMKKTIMALTIAAALSVLVLFGASWHFSSQLISPKPYTCDRDHFVYCGGARELGVPYEEVSLR
ncbi:MAG TPA: alpha/beta hydrolase, partial [Spirochaetota bacterium]|nr:alpha/beta hydrolase [Spirochaetota bacterium]